MSLSVCLFPLLLLLASGAVPPSSLYQRRVYTTNHLRGFKRDRPSLWPPGYGGRGAADRVVLDIGANNGDAYTLQGYQRGHTVFAFEPSPKVMGLFRDVMRRNHVDVALIRLRDGDDYKPFRAKKLAIPYGTKNISPKVYLLPLALSNKTGEALFHQSPCKDLNKCGKLNHLSRAYNKMDFKVPIFRLDDVTLPVNPKKIWFVKIDVEGHELEVLQGARKTLQKAQVPYIGIEFSSNGKKGTDWGVDLLEELYELGYTCFHLRGFGQCHDLSFRSPSLKCNYPFPTADKAKAPGFRQYAETFETLPGREKRRRAMSDLMCAHKSAL